MPLYTPISVSFIRPPGILKLEVEPEVEISHVKKELILYSGKYTFYLTKPLQPETTYTVTVIAGQKEPPSLDVAPTLTTSWQFTTISMMGTFFIVKKRSYFRFFEVGRRFLGERLKEMVEVVDK